MSDEERFVGPVSDDDEVDDRATPAAVDAVAAVELLAAELRSWWYGPSTWDKLYLEKRPQCNGRCSESS